MAKTKRATVYFEPEIHRALRLKAAVSERSLSDIIDEAVRLALAEDADDIAAFEARAGEPTISFEELVADLRARGEL
ncbi:MAG TPA: hypothetical protein VMN78_01310 [Longimicrobiales bacterium]|nr:hypothetical protein [Longimicrobiales bacterium]